MRKLLISSLLLLSLQQPLLALAQEQSQTIFGNSLTTFGEYISDVNFSETSEYAMMQEIFTLFEEEIQQSQSPEQETFLKRISLAFANTYLFQDEAKVEVILTQNLEEIEVPEEHLVTWQEAESYLSFVPMSRAAWSEFLLSIEHPEESVKYVIENYPIDWYAMAKRVADAYQEQSLLSAADLPDQLHFEGFIADEVAYALGYIIE